MWSAKKIQEKIKLELWNADVIAIDELDQTIKDYRSCDSSKSEDHIINANCCLRANDSRKSNCKINIIEEKCNEVTKVCIKSIKFVC